MRTEPALGSLLINYSILNEILLRNMKKILRIMKYNKSSFAAVYFIATAISQTPQGIYLCERVTKRSGIKVKVSKSSITALFDKMEFIYLIP